MTQFLRLHARDLDFHATVIKARQFADATGQSRAKKRVNFIDSRPKSPPQPEFEPLLQGNDGRGPSATPAGSPFTAAG